MFGKVGRRDVVVLVIAFVGGFAAVFVHADKLTCKCGCRLRERIFCFEVRARRQLFVAAGAGHEFADGLFGALVVVEDGVHLLGDRHLDSVAGGEAESGGSAADALGYFTVQARHDVG